MRLVGCEAHYDPYHWTNRTMRTAGIVQRYAMIDVTPSPRRALPAPRRNGTGMKRNLDDLDERPRELEAAEEQAERPQRLRRPRPEQRVERVRRPR